jgi:hypothetical protein
MKNFATDLWNDLREKRLWPVALLLLAGLFAVPVLFSKGAGEPPAASAPTASSAPEAPDPAEFEGLASVELEESLPSEGSSLDTFDPSDPFRPPEKVLQRAERPASGATAAGPTGDTATATTDGGSGASGVSSGSDGSSGVGGGTESKGGPGNDEGGAGGDGGGTTTTTTTTEYTWVIDVTFTLNGRTRKLKGFERLDMLPSRASPLLLFLGVSSNAGNAVFLVDSRLETAGEEGKCRPSKAKCAFLYLGAGSAQVFTNGAGALYGLTIDRIRKVKVDEAASASQLNKGAKASASLGATTSRRRPSSPLISDLQSVSTVVEEG